MKYHKESSQATAFFKEAVTTCNNQQEHRLTHVMRPLAFHLWQLEDITSTAYNFKAQNGHSI